MPSSQDIITQMVSDAACGLLMIVKETVQSMQNGLCPAIFVKFWQNYAKLIDSHIYHQVSIFTLTLIYYLIYFYLISLFVFIVFCFDNLQCFYLFISH